MLHFIAVATVRSIVSVCLCVLVCASSYVRV